MKSLSKNTNSNARVFLLTIFCALFCFAKQQQQKISSLSFLPKMLKNSTFQQRIAFYAKLASKLSQTHAKGFCNCKLQEIQFPFQTSLELSNFGHFSNINLMSSLQLIDAQSSKTCKFQLSSRAPPENWLQNSTTKEIQTENEQENEKNEQNKACQKEDVWSFALLLADLEALVIGEAEGLSQLNAANSVKEKSDAILLQNFAGRVDGIFGRNFLLAESVFYKREVENILGASLENELKNVSKNMEQNVEKEAKEVGKFCKMEKRREDLEAFASLFAKLFESMFEKQPKNRFTAEKVFKRLSALKNLADLFFDQKGVFLDQKVEKIVKISSRKIEKFSNFV